MDAAKLDKVLIDLLELFTQAADDFGAICKLYDADKYPTTYIVMDRKDHLTGPWVWYFTFEIEELLTWDLADFIGQIVVEQEKMMENHS